MLTQEKGTESFMFSLMNWMNLVVMLLMNMMSLFLLH